MMIFLFHPNHALLKQIPVGLGFSPAASLAHAKLTEGASPLRTRVLYFSSISRLEKLMEKESFP